MTLDDYQVAASRTFNRTLALPDQLVDAAAGLAEEAGEVLALIRKDRFQQRPYDREALRLELGDALWCLAAVATCAGFSLGEVASANLEKLRQRGEGPPPPP